MRSVMHNKKHILGIVGAFLFVLFITLILPGTATAARNVDNTYAVVITTGNDAGNGVSYIGLEYLDADGYSHMEYVFPHNGGLQASLDLASNQSKTTTETPLDRGKTNTYLFETAYEVAEIIGLDIYCQGEKGNLYAWDVSGLRLYRVDQIVDVISGSGANVIQFNGSQLAYLEERNGNGGATFSWTGNTVFQLRAQDSSYRLIFETVPYSMRSDFEYVVRMDLADINGAGFEQLNQAYNEQKPLRDLNIGEYMAIQIEYIDMFGDARMVTQPVMRSALSWMLENGIPEDSKIAALAQQGESIAFDVYLQDMQSVEGVKLYSGAEASALLGYTVSGKESVAFTGISLYPASSVGVNLSSEENAANGPEYTFTIDPLFYHTATTVEGEILTENGNLYVSMLPYEPGALLQPVETTEKYLIELIANPSQILRVPDDVLVQLRYVDMTGATRDTETYSVRSGAKEFYGYWPASTEDFAYVGQINSVNGISFIIELAQVEHFVGLTVSLPHNSGDWQMAGFRITRVDQLGKRGCVWEDVNAGGAVSNRRYYREVQGYTVLHMEEKALIQSDSPCTLDFISQGVQKVEDFDWSQYRYAMTYEQCMSNLGLTKIRENYTVEVQVQSGTTSLLDGYGDNGSKNRFYFLLEFENGVSGYVLANQQLGADGFRSGATESFVISTNYDYGELVAVHIIPDDISEDSDPYDKLNIAQIRVRRNDNGSISREWVIQNVGWVGIDYRDEGASSSIAGQQGRTESDLSRTYPISYSSYALNLEFRISTGTYGMGSNGGAFYGTMEGTLEYYDQDGKRKQLTFDVVRAMYDYANQTPVYLDDGTVGNGGTPLAVTDNTYMFRENHTDRFVISVSDVAKLGKLSLNMKSINGCTLQITNVTAAVVMETGLLQINEQDEYIRLGTTEYLCEDTVEKIPAFELVLTPERNTYQDIYFGEHETIKLDTKSNTWISAVSREPNSQNDVLNVFVYMADNAVGKFDMDVRAQYTNNNGAVLETGAKNLTKTTDADGKTIYAINGLTATGMSTMNRIFAKAQSVDVVDAYVDHIIVQQVRSGVVINTFYFNCEQRNANVEFYALPSSSQKVENGEQKVYFLLGEETEAANLVSENRDLAIALQYTTISGGSQTFASRYIYITDQQYQSIQAGDMIELTFNESYVKEITGLLIATSGNVRAQVEMACVDNYRVDPTSGAKQLMGHFSISEGVTVKNQVDAMSVSSNASVEILDIEFVTDVSATYLESGTNDPIIMVVNYTDRQGIQRELVVSDIREYVVSGAGAFSTGSTTRIRLLLPNVATVQSLQLMPYNVDPQITAGWKPSQILVLLGAEGSVQRVTRSIDKYIYEDKQLDFEQEITGAMVGGLKVTLSNLIVTTDVAATNESGNYGNSYRINSAANQAVSLTVASSADVKCVVTVSNSKEGYLVKAEQNDGLQDISQSIRTTADGFLLTMPRNTSGQDQSYRITIYAAENEEISVVIVVTVKSEEITPPPSTEAT